MPYYEVKPLQSRVKKILEEVHPLLIIREVQKWPALYVRDCPERASAHFRNKLWTEVARAVMPEWNNYSNTEKQNKLSDLMKKWRNLRDTFKRHVVEDKKIRNGLNIKKKTYVYFNHMSFLLPHMETGDEDGPAPAPARRRRAAAARPAPPAPAPAHAHAHAPPITHDKGEIDEDHHFLMSLVPSFRRMTDDEKLTAKMEILKVIRNVRGQSNYQDETEDMLADTSTTIKQEMLIDIEPEYEVNFEGGNDSADDDGAADDGGEESD